MSNTTRILIVPGLGGSEPDHWQSRWERSRPDARRVEQADWDRPIRSQWTCRLADAVEDAPGSILVGHSLGSVLIAHLAAHRAGLAIAGALLVAPADVDRARHIAPQIAELSPMPAAPLPFPAIVVASSNDPYMTAERARAWAGACGARFMNVGPCGHINLRAGFGPWPAGEHILKELIAECGAERAAATGV
jgi:predicted alpha/beta hydrolase family esterase